MEMIVLVLGKNETKVLACKSGITTIVRGLVLMLPPYIPCYFFLSFFLRARYSLPSSPSPPSSSSLADCFFPQRFAFFTFLFKKLRLCAICYLKHHRFRCFVPLVSTYRTVKVNASERRELKEISSFSNRF